MSLKVSLLALKHPSLHLHDYAVYTLFSHLFLDVIHYPLKRSASFAELLEIYNSMTHHLFWAYTQHKIVSSQIDILFLR